MCVRAHVHVYVSAYAFVVSGRMLGLMLTVLLLGGEIQGITWPFGIFCLFSICNKKLKFFFEKVKYAIIPN